MIDWLKLSVWLGCLALSVAFWYAVWRVLT